MSFLKAIRRILPRDSKESQENTRALERPVDPDAPLLGAVFNAKHYLKQVPLSEWFAACRGPLKHYLTAGWLAGLNPHPFFDVRWYLAKNPDVAAEKIEPLRHYVTLGWKEGRRPHLDFNANPYLARHPELLLIHRCPLITLAGRQADVLAANAEAQSRALPKRDWPSFYPEGRPYSYLDVNTLAERATAYRKAKGRDNKIAFFTCITGGYDTLRLPEFLSPDIDYILFTDRPTDGYGVFDVRFIDVVESDSARASRHAKLQPQHYLNGYEVVVSFDANVILREDFHPHLARFAESGLPLAFLPNPIYDCLYDDAVLCAQTGKDTPEKIVPQILRYQREGYPAHHGLIEGNLFAARLNVSAARAFFDGWWEQLSTGSRRDQLSANYVLWKLGITYLPFLGAGENTRTHSSVALIKHGTYDEAHFTALANCMKTAS